MDIESTISPLFEEDIELEEKIRLVSKLNAKMYDGEFLAELARFFLDKSLKIENPYQDAIDVVGTGGDGAKTLNYSTLSAIVAHQYGLSVVKHGNKAVTSKCGSFDFLERLDVQIPETVEDANQILKKKGIVFLFAPFFHLIFKPVAEVRNSFKEKGEKTIFNVLGPLLLPSNVKRVVIGVYEEELIDPMAEALVKLDVEYGYVVHGSGLDEFSVCGVNKVATIKQGEITRQTIHPEQLDFVRSCVSSLEAGDSFQNYEESKKILSGDMLGPKYDMLVINAAAAIQVGKAFDQSLGYYVNEVKALLEKGFTFS